MAKKPPNSLWQGFLQSVMVGSMPRTAQSIHILVVYFSRYRSTIPHGGDFSQPASHHLALVILFVSLYSEFPLALASPDRLINVIAVYYGPLLVSLPPMKHGRRQR